MKKQVFLLFAFFLFSVAGYAQGSRNIAMHAVAFYNLENLFDITHDDGKNDYDFLPDGSYHWNQQKYSHKLANMAKALADLGTDYTPNGASIIGVSEIENDHVMDDLVAQEPLKARGYKYIHFEGPDKRGVDCALIYNPKAFKVKKAFHKPYVYEKAEDSNRATRPFLCVQGTLAGDPLTVIVCHWPSRGAVAYYRDIAGKQVRQMTDSIFKAEPGMHIIVMGDMNDDPDNSSMAKYLGAKRHKADVKNGDFYNPWWEVLRGKGQGTLSYQGGWNLFDQIVLSKSLLSEDKSYRTLTLRNHHIFRRDYLLQQEGRFKGTPKRTHSGGVWLDGFSDHLPTVVYLLKSMK